MSSIGGVPGINTGLDIKGMVTSMVNAERAPKDAQLARLEKASTTKFSALGQLKSAVSDLQSVLKELNNPALFNKRIATSSNTAQVAASSSNTALSGTYQVEVKSLATASKVATQSLAGDFRATEAGSLQVRLGAAGEAVNIAIADGDDLVAIRDKLNAGLKEQGITANIVNDPAGGTSRLVLTSSATGAGKDIYVETASAGLSSLAIGSIDRSDPDNPVGNLSAVAGGAAGFLTQAMDARFSVDGLELSSSSNKVENAIPDVTLDLLAKTDANKPLTVTVGADVAGVKATVQKFVDAYNKLMDTSNDLTRVTKVGDDAPVVGGLVGDSTVRNLLNGVRTELSNASGSSSDSIRMLGDLGISIEKGGTLKIDNDKLDKVLKENYESVGAFFTGDSGITARLEKRVSGYVQTGGVLEQRMNSLNDTIKNIDKQREALDLRMTTVQSRLLRQFNAMDSLVGQLTSTSERLGQIFKSLPGVVKGD